MEQTRNFDKEVVLSKNTAAGICAGLIHSSGKGYFFSIETKSKSEKKKCYISIKQTEFESGNEGNLKGPKRERGTKSYPLQISAKSLTIYFQSNIKSRQELFQK